MPLSEHIRELRNRLIKSVLAVLVTSGVGFAFYQPILRLLLRPACVNTGIRGVGAPSSSCRNGVFIVNGVLSGLTLELKVALFAGLIMACPIWLYQLWAFLAPGLHKNEKRYGLGFTAAAVPLFVGGAALAYAIMPTALSILFHFVPTQASAAIPIEDYLKFVLRLIVVFGLSFEMPLLLVALNMLGVLSAARIRSWWRGMVFGIFVFAAVVIPTGDPFTMTLLAVPMCILFFVALGVATLNDRRRERRAAESPDADLADDEASQLDLAPSPVARPEPLSDVEPTPVAAPVRPAGESAPGAEASGGDPDGGGAHYDDIP
jgi:sec-independent protein translocase protein TatC